VEKETDFIIAPTKATKKDLINLGFKKEKIKVVYEAVEEIFKPASKKEIKRIKKKYKIKNKYILCVGINSRKNLNRSIEAFKKINGKYSDINLLVVGHKYEDVKGKKGVIFTGHVNKAYLPVIYSGAECLLYPSLYEGFGLPILEAMACKTPVVTSDRSSMKEVAGNAAVLVDADSVEDIVRGVNTALGKKDKWVKKGQKRLKDLYQKLAK
jgi:glycosyltransferase involved in cell wall biosynthesis